MAIPRAEFIASMANAAQAARKAGARINPAIAVAQAALETGFGKSKLSLDANNFFGIKAGKSWKGEKVTYTTMEFDPERGWHPEVAAFRKYPNMTECFRDYGAIIGRLSWYSDAAKNCDDPALFLAGILPKRGEPGWATDPKYAYKVWTIAKTWSLIPGNAKFPPGVK